MESYKDESFQKFEKLKLGLQHVLSREVWIFYDVSFLRMTQK